jgi:hypothetical protein
MLEKWVENDEQYMIIQGKLRDKMRTSGQEIKRVQGSLSFSPFILEYVFKLRYHG